ncbi:MAG: Hsp70 family protein [Treponema sp.]|nr:Hsp70 family protein [Treponema sp.]
MKVIGFDFGTTNSTISYFNKESNALDSFKVRAGDADYIPTVVAYNLKKNNEVSIGNTAKPNVTLKNYEAYEHFKLLLGKNADKIIEGKSKTPIQVTHDFIKKLLDEYKINQKMDEKTNLDGIVMTVPETWIREESNRTARENIIDIFKTLGYKENENFQLESEPVGAATYFCWSYKQKEGKEYTGHITVIDYGGGTLDVTLCEAMKDGKIKILERCGYGEYNETNGCAGVAFDETVVEKLIRDKNLPIKRGEPKFIDLRNSFENRKINECEQITKDLKDYYDDPDIVEGDSIFQLKYNDEGDTFDVCCKDLDECFCKVNAPKLKESLEQIKQYFSVYNINSNAPENFKVLLVGGFSNFYAVEKEVRESFGVTSGNIDKRFEQPFEIKNRTLAISRGAALIAAGEFSIEHTCTHNYGYVTYGLGKESDNLIPYFNPIIKKGENLKKYSEPLFADRKEYVKHPAGKLFIYIDDGRPNNAGRSQPIPLGESVKELFPNVDNDYADKWYQIGFSVSRNQIPTIYIKDKHGTVISSTSLNKLIEKIGISQ